MDALRTFAATTLLAVSTLLLGTACGSSGSGGVVGAAAPPPGGGGGTLTASVDGVPFSAELNAGATTSPANPGVYILTGARLVSGTTAQVFVITLYNITGPGTYALGMGPTVAGGTASFTDGSTTWLTPLSGAAGTLTITALTAGVVAGTFSFTAEPIAGGGASRVVTGGTFNLPVTGTAGVLPPNARSAMSAKLGGVPWNAATVVTVNHTGGVYAFGGSTTTTFVNFTLSSVTGPAVIPLDATLQRLTVFSGTQSWVSTVGSGTVTVTEVSATRIKGTVTATLQGTSGSLAVTDGVFDVGLP